MIYVIDYRFTRTPDGRIWSDGLYGYEFWGRYRRVFEEVTLVSRVRDIASPQPGSVEVCGPGVKVHAVPFYLGPYEFVIRRAQVNAALEEVLHQEAAIFLRIPAPLATQAATILKRAGRRYGVEVIGDAYEAFAPGATRTPLRPIFRWWYSKHQKLQCAEATVANYVFGGLQLRYPALNAAAVSVCSDVYLDSGAYRAPVNRAGSGELVCVSTLQQRYKGIDVLIAAVRLCVAAGVDCRLNVVGDGRLRGELQAQAADLGDRVRFAGHLSGAAQVRAALDDAALFVLPSRTEGMPRALLEAMARGLPCIASKVGGVPELLAPEDVVTPGNAHELAAAIQQTLADPVRASAMAARNFETSKRYSEWVLTPVREQTYRILAEDYARAAHR